MARVLYTLALLALLPWAVLHLLWRARRQPDYLKHWGERFGCFRPRPPGPLIWIHAVSVGETRAAQPLIAALAQRFPDHRILLTHMTPTGRATAKALFGGSVTRSYLPYDTPWAVRRFLRHYRPDIGIVMETELWPNLIAACTQACVPLLLVNARLSDKSARRYARFPNLTRTALRSLSAIGAIGAEDARRLQALGAPAVEVVGNMKFDLATPAAQLALGQSFRNRAGGRPVFLCASTREGEEALILDAWEKVFGKAESLAALGTATAWRPAPSGLVGGGTAGNALLAIVPRHPQRFDEVARLIEARDFALQRRSDDRAIEADTQVWLGDSMGEMFAYYAAASVDGVAFVGGSLLDFGCQNLIEACTAGTPVLLGPSTYNFADAARDALAAGAARQVQDAGDLVAQALELLGNPAARPAMAEAGRAFAARHQGATASTLNLIERFIPATR
jgi:3-deoxy-D-manno-octulosonic-acid transferase